MEPFNTYNCLQQIAQCSTGTNGVIEYIAVYSKKRRAGDISFYAHGPRLWNQLPKHIREASTLKVFKKLIKSHLFPDVNA